MTRPATGRPLRGRALLALAALGSALALGGCASLGNVSGSDKADPQLATSQTNLTSLTEVIEKSPNDPQAYNMRGSVYGQAGRPELALADFNKAVGLDP